MQRTPILLAALALATACTPSEPEVSFATGRALFVENCAVCHGESGQGDSEIAAHLVPPPANLTTIAARNGGRFPRAEILSKIDGYQRVEYEGISMPEFGTLFAGETIPLDTGDGKPTPTPVDLVNLLTYLEGIQTGR